jgi:hypothetical protein
MKTMFSRLRLSALVVQFKLPVTASLPSKVVLTVVGGTVVYRAGL